EYSSSCLDLRGKERARLVFADPPYNVQIVGHVGGLGSIQPREFAMACGEMSEAQFTQFLTPTFLNVAGVSLNGAIHFICMDWRHIGETLAAAKMVYSEFNNPCLLNQNNHAIGP